MKEEKQTWYSRENRKKSGSALMMIVLMLMSTQMYNFIGVEEEPTNLEMSRRLLQGPHISSSTKPRVKQQVPHRGSLLQWAIMSMMHLQIQVG